MGEWIYRLEASSQLHVPTALPRERSTGTHWIGPRSRSGRYGEVEIFGPTGTRSPIPRSSSPYPVAQPTALSRADLSVVNRIRSAFCWAHYLRLQRVSPSTSRNASKTTATLVILLFKRSSQVTTRNMACSLKQAQFRLSCVIYAFRSVRLNGLLIGKPKGKRPLRRPRRRWVDITMDLEEIGLMWIGLVWLRIGTSGELLRMR
jgi:hypothetical protein